MRYLSDVRYDVPFVPTLEATVRRMLEMAEVGPLDFVYDLGCGDGRILVAAVEDFEAKGAVGYEVREELYKEALSRIEGRGLRGRVELFNEDLFKADLSEATVITLYLSHSANNRLRPKLELEARPGTRVVSHDFEIKGWHAVRRERYRGDTIYLYVVPEALDMLETLEKVNKDILRLQSILHQGYLELRESLTRIDEGTYALIDGKYVYRLGGGEDKNVISVWTKPMEQPGSRCLFNAPITLT